ncbi:MAG: YafY family transcriptional regulator [Clostridiales bacterium]|nr:YafY family transcriptional regulator [Clostridiales bacterium]
MLGVSVRTVYRDVETLSVAGVPVYASAGKGGGISLTPGYAVQRALLTDEEQSQILFAIQSLRATDQQVEPLLTKLGGLFHRRNVNWIEVDFSRWGLGKADKRTFETLRNAILEKRVTEILYGGASGDLVRRRVKPFKLVFKSRNWYLQAYCLRADAYRLFKVSRIVELTPTSETFADTFEDAPPSEGEPGAAPAMTDLLLRFGRTVAFRVYDEFDRESVAPQPDGSILVRTALPADEWLAGYLLTFGAEVDILEPADVRERVAALAKRTFEHHQT